jgi:signal transduction histidine kinase
MEEALRTTEKIAAVGRLATSVAHEINNPLEAIINLIYLAKNHDTASDAVRAYLADAEEELIRVAHLTKQTLGFYREQKGATRTQVGIHLRQLLAISSSKTKNKEIDIQLEIGQDPEIVAIPGEIRQLLANILNNAIDAVDYGGVIRIRISAGRRWDLQTPGVQITFVDSGPGIALPDRAKVFEPFYTTKPAVGTGLGLWICKSIVDRHAGKIQIRSNTTPGRSWTAVSVFLPAEVPYGNLSDGSAQAILCPTADSVAQNCARNS